MKDYGTEIWASLTTDRQRENLYKIHQTEEMFL